MYRNPLDLNKYKFTWGLFLFNPRSRPALFGITDSSSKVRLALDSEFIWNLTDSSKVRLALDSEFIWNLTDSNKVRLALD